MNKTKKTIGISIILLFLLLLWIVVIFSFSLRSGTTSHSESGFVEATLSAFARHLNLNVNRHIFQIFSPFVKDGSHITGGEFIRKSAHFTEYFIFGLLCCATALFLYKRSKLWFIPLLCGIFVSFADEKIIQLFLVSGRTSSFMDVLLDCIGFYLAIILSALIYSIVNEFKNLKSSIEK